MVDFSLCASGSYNWVNKPTVAMTYTFSPHSTNAMLVLPPEDSPDTRPKYYVSVGPNCWNPTSWITTVRRGASESGELVGDFEWVRALGLHVLY
jgi:hypothetical protein